MTTAESGSVAAARSILNDLIRQRHRMQATDPDRGLLEANRLAIVYWQQQLLRAIEAEHDRARAVA